MSILLKERDYAVNEMGGLETVSGGSAVLNEVLFRLSARRGAFPLMPSFGSRLYLLRREKASQRQALACRYAAEALSDLPEVTVRGASVREEETGLRVTVELTWQGETLQVEVEGFDEER